MNIFNSQKGMALVTTLLLSLIGLGLVLVVFNLVITGTRTSGTIKRYTTALEAAKGGAEDFINSLSTTSFNVNPSDPNWYNGHNCKVDRDTDNWTVICGVSMCGSNNTNCTSHSKPQDIINNYDWKKDYGDYSVYVKIVDVKGTADGYYLYTIDIISKNNNTSEQAWISIVYQKPQ